MSLSGPLSSINDVDSQLAVELASEISPIKEVLSRHGITPEQLRVKLTDTRFRQMLREARRVWNSDLSVKERIRVKSAVLVEDSLIRLYEIFNNGEVATPARLEAFKSMAKVAEVYEPAKTGPAMGERVAININLGGQTLPVAVEGTARVIEGEVAT